MTTWLHAQRLEAVAEAVRASGARRVLDLGCGDGDLFLRLAATPGIDALIGLDICRASLERLRARLARAAPAHGKVELREASLSAPAPDLAGFDCAVLVEVIEHVAPEHLSALEQNLLHRLRPRTLVLTTPNAEFNPLLGVPPHRFRHPGHRFEWTRAQFRRWCTRAARAAGYEACFSDIAGCHPQLGGASQMAVLRRRGGRNTL